MRWSTQLVLRPASRSAFSQVGVEPLGLDRPGADERLEDQGELGVVGAPAAERWRAIGGPNASSVASHAAGIQVSAAIRARTSPERLVSWVIVDSSVSGYRSARSALRGVERVDVDAEATRVAADVVERQQAAVAVEGGVLDPLGHDRRGRLLEADEVRGAGVSLPSV